MIKEALSNRSNFNFFFYVLTYQEDYVCFCTGWALKRLIPLLFILTESDVVMDVLSMMNDVIVDR